MSKKVSLIIAAVIIVIVAVVVGVMMLGDSKASTYEIKDGNLVITSSFGTSVPLADITLLELTDTAPDIKTKTNGSGIGSMYKGEFLLTDGSAARLYIDAKMPPFIRFVQGDTVFYLNSDSAEATQSLFAELEAAVG